MANTSSGAQSKNQMTDRKRGYPNPLRQKDLEKERREKYARLMNFSESTTEQLEGLGHRLSRM